jgi:hypothetical protein
MFKFWEKVFDPKRWFFLVLIYFLTYGVVYSVMYQIAMEGLDPHFSIQFFLGQGPWANWNAGIAVIAAWMGVCAYDLHFYPKKDRAALEGYEAVRRALEKDHA